MPVTLFEFNGITFCCLFKKDKMASLERYSHDTTQISTYLSDISNAFTSKPNNTMENKYLIPIGALKWLNRGCS